MGVVTLGLFGGFLAATIFFCGHPTGIRYAGYAEEHPEIIWPCIMSLGCVLLAYVCILEYYTYERMTQLPILWTGIIAIPLSIIFFVYTLQSMWRAGLRPVWMR